MYRQDPEGKPKNATIQDNRDGTYTVSYVPDSTGPYTITIKYGGDEIPYSPYRIQSLPTGDASKCRLTGEKNIIVLMNKKCRLAVEFAYFYLNPAFFFLSSVYRRTWSV